MQMQLFSKLQNAPMLFGLTAVFWVVLFLTGGGSRADIQSLIVLRPVAVIMLGYGLWGLSRKDWEQHAFLFVFLAATVFLAILHLLPLPHSLWSNLPGRDLIAQTDRLAGLGTVWRPLTMVPTDSWNALLALLIPVTAAVLLCRIRSDQWRLLLALCLSIGVISAFVAVLQLLGPDGSPLYFYRITNRGMAVGLFANRNHHAVFLACLLPMLAVFASAATHRFGTHRFWLLASGAAGAFLILLIIISGSRAGLIVGLIGVCAVPALYAANAPSANRAPQRPKSRKSLKLNYKIVGPLLVIAGIVAVAILSSRAASLDRLLAGFWEDDIRFQVWGPIAQMAWSYLPFGSGVGTFAEVYKIHENSAMLSAEYLNHAHNDLLELVMTTGLPGLLLLLVAVFAWGKKAYWLFFAEQSRGQSSQFARLGAVLILMLSVGSLVDYPLRTPSLSALFILAAIWMGAGKKMSVPPKQDK